MAKGKPVDISATGCGFCAATQTKAETMAVLVYILES